MAYTCESLTDSRDFIARCEAGDWTPGPCPFSDNETPFPPYQVARAIVDSGGKLYVCYEDGDLQAVGAVAILAEGPVIVWARPCSAVPNDDVLVELYRHGNVEWNRNLYGLIDADKAADLVATYPDRYALIEGTMDRIYAITD